VKGGGGGGGGGGEEILWAKERQDNDEGERQKREMTRSRRGGKRVGEKGAGREKSGGVKLEIKLNGKRHKNVAKKKKGKEEGECAVLERWKGVGTGKEEEGGSSLLFHNTMLPAKGR